MIIIFVLNGCKQKKEVYDSYESETLVVEKISNNVFQHISYLNTKSLGKYPCNGMVYFNGDDVIIFDTPTTNEATEELLNWIGKKNIKAIIVTHFHIDCLGGLEEFHSKGVKSYATHKTIDLAQKDNVKILPQNGFEKQKEFQIGEERVLAKFFGEGHTKDNVIGYVKSEKTIFGGCLIKHLNAPKGNLQDANIKDWSTTVENIKAEIPEIDIVIPGHGKSGSKELLEYTINLFN